MTRSAWSLLLVPVAVALLAGASSVQFSTDHGTLIVETDDPAVKVSLDGQELKVTGAGPSEIRLAVGPHLFRTEQPGQPPRNELLSVSNGGRVVVRVRAGPPAPAKPARSRDDLIRDARQAAGELVGLRDDIDSRIWADVSNRWTKAEAAKLLLGFHRGPGEVPGFAGGPAAAKQLKDDLAKLRKQRAEVFGLWAEAARMDAAKPGANPLWGVWDVAQVRGAGGVAADSLDLFDPDPVGRRLAVADGGAALNTGAGYWGFGSKMPADGPGTIDLDVPVRGDTVFRGRFRVDGDSAVLRLNPINAPRSADPDGDPTDGGFVLHLRRATATVASAAGPMVPPGGELPRYRLTPGREISYRYEASFKYGEGKGADDHRDRTDWTGWVLRANPDGSARMMVRLVNVFTQTRDGKKVSENTRTQVLYADVFPDGRIPSNPTIRYRGSPTAILPRLPGDAAEAEAGWSAPADDGTVVSKPAGVNRFTVSTVGQMSKIYLTTNDKTYTFDPARGLVARAETASSQRYGYKGVGTGTIELTGEKTLPPAELAELVADADRYFAATGEYDKLTESAGKLPPDEAKAALAKAFATVKSAVVEVSQQALREELAEKVKTHEREAKYILDEAERRAKVVGQPAFAFAATDMDEKPVGLDDLKGKVLVLDFWYRGCGWCIKAMPQINQLAGDFAGEPVAVVGMNTDTDKADAEFVIREMGLKYPTLRIKHDLSEKFGVRGFPTLVLIDKKGVVRDLHVGYSATLREDVGKAVRGLLAE